MNRSIGLLLVAIVAAMCGAAPANATLKAIEQAYELGLNQLTLPGAAGGTVIVRKCPACKPESVTVTGDTQCFVRPGKKPVALPDWLKAAAAAGQSRQSMVYVYYAPDTRRVTRIVLSPGAR